MPEQDEFRRLLRGGFAPVVTLFREFHEDKSHIVLEGLPFSAWSLLEHMRHRQARILAYLRDPEAGEPWPAAWWPEDPAPGSGSAWQGSIAAFEKDLEQIIDIVENPPGSPHAGTRGPGLTAVAVAVLQHNAYHVGQLKVIGRQLGVW